MSKNTVQPANTAGASAPAAKPAKQAEAKAAKSSEAKAKRPAEPNAVAAKVAAFKEYLILARAELRKVSWPTWKETRVTTLVVLGFVVVMAVLLGLVDLLLSTVARLILS